MDNNLKARVFISCGQRKGSQEEKIALEIYEKLKTLGYDPYLAIEEQTLKGLKENIFPHLDSSEYFIFVDFKREKIILGDESIGHRGSLFAHQELAVASFLDKRALAFQGEGVKKDDGIMKFIQANCITFHDRQFLPGLVEEGIKNKEWKSNWHDELILLIDNECGTEEETDAGLVQYYHVAVKNLNPYKSALSCYVFLESVKDVAADRSISFETVEYKWRGVSFPNVVITSNSSRHFDTFIIQHSNPNVAHSSNFSDGSQHHVQTLTGPGDFELTFKVISDNFRPAIGSFVLHLNNDIKKVTLKSLISAR